MPRVAAGMGKGSGASSQDSFPRRSGPRARLGQQTAFRRHPLAKTAVLAGKAGGISANRTGPGCTPQKTRRTLLACAGPSRRDIAAGPARRRSGETHGVGAGACATGTSANPARRQKTLPGAAARAACLPPRLEAGSWRLTCAKRACTRKTLAAPQHFPGPSLRGGGQGKTPVRATAPPKPRPLCGDDGKRLSQSSGGPRTACLPAPQAAQGPRAARSPGRLEARGLRGGAWPLCLGRSHS
jgi:hypothetical protein